MSTIVADFEKQFTGGATVRAAFERRADEFSTTILFGPSGSGKTTILRCLAGLEKPQRGTIRHGDHIWLDTAAGVCRPPQKRGIGFLFQDYALFPHMTVADNIAHGLHDLSKAQRRGRVGQMLDMLGLHDMENRHPHQLSGGEQQRIALARAVVRRPRLLLLDEPLSALDAETRERLRRELRKLLAEFAIPCFIVTHDRLEAMSLGDYVMVLDRGTVLQAGALDEVFSRPANTKVAAMVGIETVLPARLVNVDNDLATLAVGQTELIALAPPASDDQLFICIRGEDVIIQKEAIEHTSARNRLPATIVSLNVEGPVIRVELDCGFRLVAIVTKPAREELSLRQGDQVTAMIKAPAIHVISRGRTATNLA